MQYVLGIDLGTTGNRAIAFDQSGRIAAQAYAEFEQIYPRPGWVEHNASEILTSAVAVLRQVIGEVGAGNIAAVGLTNQRETTVLWDRGTGEPIHNAIVWQCRRTDEICRELKSHEAEVRRRTGLFLDPYFSATKIKWLLDHVPGARERAENGELCFGTIDTWLLWNISRERAHCTEPANASRTLLYNLHTGEFDDELLAIFDIPRAVLPEILPSNARFGSLKADLADHEIPIHAMLGDQQASLYSHGGWQQGVVKNTYGTGLFLMTSTGTELPDAGRLLNTAAWTDDAGACFALEGSVFIGGAAVQWLRDGLGLIDSAEKTEEMAAGLSSNDDVFFVPALAGLGAPYWDPAARGAILGITRQTRAEHIARATLEGIAYQTRDVIDEFTSIMPRSGLSALRVDGGACRNDWLMQFQADLLQVPVIRPRILESTALGSAGMAAIACGMWTRDNFVQINGAERTFEPQVAKAEADMLYARWQEAVKRSLGWAPTA